MFFIKKDYYYGKICIGIFLHIKFKKEVTMKLKYIIKKLLDKIIKWHYMDKSHLIKNEFENRWEPLFIETRFESLEDCVLALTSNHCSGKSKFWREGIIGDVNSDGSFELLMKLPRTQRSRYVGQIKEVNRKYCLVGCVRPKKSVSKRMFIYMLIYCALILKISYSGYTAKSGYNIVFYVFSIFTFFMIFPMILDAILKMDCRKTAKLIGENIYAKVRILE